MFFHYPNPHQFSMTILDTHSKMAAHNWSSGTKTSSSPPLQLTLHITPLKEGDLEVLGFVYNLCVDTTQLKGSESPIQTSIRTNLPSLSFSSRDSLYQKHQSRGVQEILAEGVQGKVEIRIQGPRMNNTKVEKSSVAYGRDYRLHWSVTSPMPKLVVRVMPTFVT